MPIFIILSKLILLGVAVGLEIYGLQLFFSPSIAEQNLITALFCHFIASAVAAYIFPTVVVPGQAETSLRATLFFFVIVFYLPVLGLIGLILALSFVGFSSKKPKSANLCININKIRDLPSDAGVTGGQPVNSHSLYDLYRSRNPEIRLQAVYATLKLKDRDAIPLLRLALADSIDDIRLLAYALLDRKEYRLSKHIEKSKQDLENIENPRKKKQLCRQIANDYWELAHLGLVQGEAKNHVLRMAYKYIEMGLGYSPQDSGLIFQYAQILLKLGKYQQALEQFKKAEIFGIECVGLLTYYAEIAFYTRHYHEVKQLMTGIELPAAYPLLTTTARFWQKEG